MLIDGRLVTCKAVLRMKGESELNYLRNLFLKKQPVVMQSIAEAMQRKDDFTFKNYFLLYACPLCGDPPALSGYGQSILWIALKCINDKEAISFCDSCEQHFRIPAAIFAEGILCELTEVSQIPGDQLYNYVKAKYVETNTQLNLLHTGWYDFLIEANANGPVDVMAMTWNPKDECPLCGRRPYRPIGFSYACPNCMNEINIAQEDIDPELGVRVICNHCMKTHYVPPTVWCPKCHKSLFHYYSILRRIAKANGVNFEQLRLKKNEAG